MDNLFSEFIKKLIINKTTKIIENSENLKSIFNNNKDQHENKCIRIIEQIYLISKDLEKIIENLEELQSNIYNSNNFEIPNNISSKIKEEIQFKENINELLPIYCYLLYLKLLEN